MPVALSYKELIYIMSAVSQVLLLDEITVDLDVLARADLLKFLKKECEERGATIIYATHIFDGLEDWPSHIVSLVLIPLIL